MTVNSIWCCAVQKHVPCVTNREGDVVSVLCAERQAATRTCAEKAHAVQHGPLGVLFRPGDWIGAEQLASRCTLG